MKFKNNILIILSIIISVSLLSCNGKINMKTETKDYVSVNNNLDQIGDPDNNNTIIDNGNNLIINNSADKIRSYNTLESLLKVSTNIISGTCISSKNVFRNETLYTLSQVKIDKTFKGSLNSGDVVLVMELGGRVTFGDYEIGCNLQQKEFETDGQRLDKDKNIIVGYDGNFPMKTSEEVLLFIVDETEFFAGNGNQIFGIVGSYDGKFNKFENEKYKKADSTNSDVIEFKVNGLEISTKTLDDLN